MSKTFVNQEALNDLHKNDWIYIHPDDFICIYDIYGQSQCYNVFDGKGVKVREKILGGRKIGRKIVVVVGCYNMTKGFKKKIDYLQQKNVQLLSTLREYHENFILCAFKYGTFLSLICDQMSSSYFIPVVLPYCQLIDRDKSMFKKSCDPVMNVFKSNTVPQVSLPIIIINY